MSNEDKLNAIRGLFGAADEFGEALDEYDEVGRMTYRLFDSFMRAGFTHDEALTIVINMMTASVTA